MKTYRVTQDDIDRGVRFNGHACPVARAIRREHTFLRPVAHSSRIEFYFLHWVFGPEIRRVDTPPEVAAWIIAFDSRKPVEPMEFTL